MLNLLNYIPFFLVKDLGMHIVLHKMTQRNENVNGHNKDVRFYSFRYRNYEF